MSWQSQYSSNIEFKHNLTGFNLAYVDTNLVGSGRIYRAAIIGLKGGVWATTAGLTVHRFLGITCLIIQTQTFLRFLRKNKLPL